MQQCGTEVEQAGTLCVSLLTRHYTSRGLDDENEGIPRRGVFLPSDPVVFLQAPN